MNEWTEPVEGGREAGCRTTDIGSGARIWDVGGEKPAPQTDGTAGLG